MLTHGITWQHFIKNIKSVKKSKKEKNKIKKHTVLHDIMKYWEMGLVFYIVTIFQGTSNTTVKMRHLNISQKALYWCLPLENNKSNWNKLIESERTT